MFGYSPFPNFDAFVLVSRCLPLTLIALADTMRSTVGRVAQLGERCNRTAEVKGSNPFTSTKPI